MIYSPNLWAVASIDFKKVKNLKRELAKFKLDIEYRIPCVQVCRKHVKNKPVIEDVPILFHYGFFKLPFDIASDLDRLSKIQDQLTCLNKWMYMRDADREFLRRKAVKQIKERITKDFDAKHHIDIKIIQVKTVREQDVERLESICKHYSIYSGEDILALKKGQEIYLKGYPFDGMKAEVVSVSIAHQTAVVLLGTLIMGDQVVYKQVTLPFSNIFYSIYENFDEGFMFTDDFQQKKTKSNEKFL